MKKHMAVISCLLLFAIMMFFTGCKSSSGIPIDINQNNLRNEANYYSPSEGEPVFASENLSKEDETMATELDNTTPGKLSLDTLIGCINAWTSLKQEDGLSTFNEVREKNQWIDDPYISQCVKEARAIQFENGDILILMATNNIADIEKYSQYINDHANGMAKQSDATADVDIDPKFTIIVISKEKCSVIKNAVNCAFMGRWPE